MKRLDASEHAVTDISWSPDGKWVAYVLGEEIRIANIETNEIRIIGQGTSPRITSDMRIIFEKQGEIYVAAAGNVRSIISKSDIVKETNKGFPIPSPNGETLLFCVFNVFDKVSQSLNAYPYRHFIGQSNLVGQKAKVTSQQWYGGDMVWFDHSQSYLHYEFDSTVGPQIRMINIEGKAQCKMIGLYPSISPDSRQVAAKPRNGGAVVIYSTKGEWSNDSITTEVIKIPLDKSVRPSAVAPIWLDNRTLIVPEGDNVFRIDTKKDKAETLKKIPLPTNRRRTSMVPSPDRENIAMELEVEGGFELRVMSPY